MKSLVIAEKPSVAKDIARVLGCHKSSKSFIEGNNYVLTWALGHLVTLKDPEGYDKKYKEWNLEQLPIIPTATELDVIGKTAFQYKAIKELIHRNDIKEIIIATDAGREGELVARWILEKAKSAKPVKRLWISSVTDKAIKEGFSNLKDGKAYIPLYHAAQARAEADWLVGINATRALTSKHNAQLSCGRVQTPTLAMVAKKEDEVRAFRPKDFYTVKFSYNGTDFTYQDKKSGAHRIFEKEIADSILNKIKNQTGKIIYVDKKRVLEIEKGLYDLTLLQRDANRLYGYSPKQTLDIMQALYERHKVLTYPRTDSNYISTDIVPTIAERLKAVRFPIFKKYVSEILAAKKFSAPSFVNNAKVSDHHAIIPTEVAVEPSQLNDSELKIYTLVIRRFLAVMMPPFEYDKISVKADISGEIFVAKGKTVIKAGFKEIYGMKDDSVDDSEIKEQILPEFKNAQPVSASKAMLNKAQTAPPPYFTEGSLVYAMENPKAYLESGEAEFAKTLGETGGLGTVATRADIIEKLFSSFYIEKRGNHLFATAKGRQVLKLAPKELRSPDLTVEWELKLNKIASNKLDKNRFLSEIKEYTVNIIGEIKGSKEVFKHDNITGKKCPECGKFLLEVSGKKGKMLVCQDRDCGYRKNIALNSNARCPQCHKKLLLMGDGENKFFSCACGYRERLSDFEKRREGENNKLDKKDIDRYLKKVNKEESVSSSKLADALKDFKFN